MIAQASAVSEKPAFAPGSEEELADYLSVCTMRGISLRAYGGDTRTPPAETDSVCGELTTRRMSGIVAYEPGELTLIARAGTPMAKIEAALAKAGQMLAFEPIDHRHLTGAQGMPTIGGVVAANVSGPRRILAGACRDHLLGIRMVDGGGRLIKNGGRVMKNVTGLDLGKLMCGSRGTLGVLTEVALRTLPAPETEETLVFDHVSEAEACALFATALATPFEISGAAFRNGAAWIRIEGRAAQVAYRRERLRQLLPHRGGDTLGEEASRTLWREVSEVRWFAASRSPLWRIHVKPSEAPAAVLRLRMHGGETSLDWGGGLVWYCGEANAAQIRAAVGAGHATALRRGALGATETRPVSSPLVRRLSIGLKRKFDPAGILNSEPPAA